MMMTHANDVRQIMRDIPSPYLVVVALYGTLGHLKTAGFRKIHSDLWVQCHSVGWGSKKALTGVKQTILAAEIA